VIELEDGIDAIEKDDTVSIDFEKGIVAHEGNAYHFPALPEEVLSILKNGGLIPHVRKELGKGMTAFLSLIIFTWSVSLEQGSNCRCSLES